MLNGMLAGPWIWSALPGHSTIRSWITSTAPSATRTSFTVRAALRARNAVSLRLGLRGPEGRRVPELPVAAVGVHQLRVRAALGNLAVVQDDDLVNLVESRQFVGDEQGGAVRGEGQVRRRSGAARAPGSRWAVGSSRISTAGSASRALARASRCRSPPDIAAPCVPTRVSQRSGRELIQGSSPGPSRPPPSAHRRWHPRGPGAGCRGWWRRRCEGLGDSRRLPSARHRRRSWPGLRRSG